MLLNGDGSPKIPVNIQQLTASISTYRKFIWTEFEKQDSPTGHAESIWCFEQSQYIYARLAAEHSRDVLSNNTCFLYAYGTFTIAIFNVFKIDSEIDGTVALYLMNSGRSLS